MTVVASGSVAFDYILTFNGRFADHLMIEHAHSLNLSFLVESMEKRRGGVASNYAYNLALLGRPAAILATVGEDAGDYRHWLESQGVDCAGLVVLAGEQTATGFITTDLAHNQITGYFGGAMLRAGEIGLDQTVAEPEAVIIGPNAPAAMSRLVRECRERRLRWVYDPAHQLPRLSTAELLEGARGAWILIGSEYELELIRRQTGLGDTELAGMSEFVVTTYGSRGSAIQRGEQVFAIPPCPARQEMDPVGAGDAYRAGLVCGLLTGLGPERAGRLASVVGAYAVEQTGTVEHRFDLTQVRARYRDTYGHDPWDQPAAD